MTIRRITPKLVRVLDLLGNNPQGISGYEIRKTLNIQGPTVYVMLGRLVEDGWVSTQPQPSPHNGSPPRKIIKLTELGQSKAAEINERADYASRHVVRG